MGTIKRREFLGFALASLAASRVAQAQQEWPSRAVHFIVPFPPGGGADTVARAVGSSAIWPSTTKRRSSRSRCSRDSRRAVRQDFPARTLEEFIAYVKARSGTVTCGTPPSAGMGHLALERLQQRAGIRLIHTPYRGAPDAVREIQGGHIA